MKYSCILAASLIMSAFTMHAERQVCYARANQPVTFSIPWGSDNYGTIQWQLSKDSGETWSDVRNAKSPSLTVNATNAVYRAVVTGDPSCPPVTEEREIRIIEIGSTVVERGFNYITLEVDASALADAGIAEYGFTSTLTGLNRPYQILPRVKTGESLPSEKFRIICEGLNPSTTYSLRPYFKTADGAVVFGEEKSAQTTAGVMFDSEGWTIETNYLGVPFTVTDENQVKNVRFYFGNSKENLSEYTPSADGGGKYHYNRNRLQAGNTYYVRLTAEVGTKQIQVDKEVKTWSDYSKIEVDETVRPVTHAVEWDNKNLICLTPDNLQVEYPRMCRVDENKILLAYHGGETEAWLNTYLRKSYDNGKTWTDPVEIYNKQNSFLGSGYYRIVNPEMTRLSNGWIILTVVANAKPETNQNCKVLASISKDGGETWGDPIVVGRERTWEPQVVQLPNGELELLVSSEGWWWDNQRDNIFQQIVSARSNDFGETWTSYDVASYKPGARDGMPVSVVMQGNKGVAFIEESVGGGVPPTIQFRKLNEKFDGTNWNGADSNRRWRVDALDTGAGAPYMIQLPTGEFLIMAHQRQTGSVWQTCRPTTVLADNTGKNFRYAESPLASVLPSQCGAYYNSFFLYDNDTVWLVFTKAQYDGTVRKESDIMIMQGKIVEK